MFTLSVVLMYSERKENKFALQFVKLRVNMLRQTCFLYIESIVNVVLLLVEYIGSLFQI